MYYGRNPHFFKLVSTACKNFKIPLIAQIVEWELAVMGLQQSQYDALSRFYRHALNNSDAFIVISAYLEDRCKYADMQLGLRRPCLRVPVLFDASAWEGIKPKIRARPYLLYCAALENYTADAILLLTAFSLSRLEGYDLLLVGNAGHSTCEALKSKALSLGIDHDVTVISDYLDEEDLLSLYAGAAVLLAPLNDDDQSRARFPSKIAHYVYSGNPVITNDVGEISRYFTDKESVFLARPNDPVDLANVMFEAATSAESKAIGQRGKNVAITEFSIEKHGRRLADFFTSVVSR